jgi:excisionase family DNA binding protein
MRRVDVSEAAGPAASGAPARRRGAQERDGDHRLLSPDDLSEYLGIPVQTIYQWRHRGEGPPGYRIGRHVRYRWVDVQAWLATRCDGIPRSVDAASR